MANTTVVTGKQIRITVLDADWIWTTEIGNVARLSSITFIPSAANDRMLIHEASIDGAELFDTGVVSGTDARTKYFDGGFRCVPVIDISDCTLGTAANAKVIFEVC
jgi:hypothetical protein